MISLCVLIVISNLFFIFSRNFSRSAILSDDDLPYHIVVGMPALSPTMETGTLSEWYVEEGSGFSAGESIAKIETDKASIDFEAQDDGFIAKILMDPGTEDIEVGVPIMVTVEEEEDEIKTWELVLYSALGGVGLMVVIILIVACA